MPMKRKVLLLILALSTVAFAGDPLPDPPVKMMCGTCFQ